MTEKNNNNAKILIVDDSQESIDLLLYFLKPANYQIFTAMDGEEALKQVEKISPQAPALKRQDTGSISKCITNLGLDSEFALRGLESKLGCGVVLHRTSTYDL